MLQTATAIKTLGFLLNGRWITEGEPVEVIAPYGRGSSKAKVYPALMFIFYIPALLPVSWAYTAARN